MAQTTQTRIIRNAIRLDAMPSSVTSSMVTPTRAAARRRAPSATKTTKTKKTTPERYRLLPGETSDQRAARLRKEFYADLQAQGIAPWEPEYQFALQTHRRKWAMDLAWPSARIAVEIEGRGSHQRGRYWTDMEKYNRAAAMGWLLIRISYEMIANDIALALVKEVFAYRAIERREEQAG